ncbi:hypothetical protein [Anthocerotibacter panamensis]|uniref:hypothetical protein n=1 Tax=Anthocerotibacter panamensis TaxID=2857077 RepID=UPI001C405B50|nr:hypothetical protein [Anthocerotibacter panamensis]
MLKVSSYLKVNEEFILASQFTNQVSDPDYIEGAIEIEFCEEILLGLRTWDYIDQLWSYFVNGLVEVAEGKEFKTFLPDQPVQITFKPDIASRRVTVEEQSTEYHNISINYVEFMGTMITEGKAFFSKMSELLPEEQFYKDEYTRLLALEQKFTHLL